MRINWNFWQEIFLRFQKCIPKYFRLQTGKFLDVRLSSFVHLFIHSFAEYASGPRFHFTCRGDRSTLALGGGKRKPAQVSRPPCAPAQPQKALQQHQGWGAVYRGTWYRVHAQLLLEQDFVSLQFLSLGSSRLSVGKPKGTDERMVRFRYLSLPPNSHHYSSL